MSEYNGVNTLVFYSLCEHMNISTPQYYKRLCWSLTNTGLLELMTMIELKWEKSWVIVSPHHSISYNTCYIEYIHMYNARNFSNTV